MVLGTKTMIPQEVMILIARTRFYNHEENDKSLAEDVDTMDELTDLAKISITTYKKRITKSYNKNTKIKRF